MNIVSLSAVLMPFVSVSAFVAYRHPAAYRTVCAWFLIVATPAFVALLVWEAGATIMYYAMAQFIDRDKLDAAEKAANAIAFMNWKWIVVSVCLFGYLIFLDSLESLGIVAPDAVKKPEPGKKPAASTQAAPRSRLDELTSLLGSLPDDDVASRRYRKPEPPALPQSRHRAPS
jgi:hypothetical protein